MSQKSEPKQLDIAICTVFVCAILGSQRPKDSYPQTQQDGHGVA